MAALPERFPYYDRLNLFTERRFPLPGLISQISYCSPPALLFIPNFPTFLFHFLSIKISPRQLLLPTLALTLALTQPRTSTPTRIIFVFLPLPSLSSFLSIFPRYSTHVSHFLMLCLLPMYYCLKIIEKQ